MPTCEPSCDYCENYKDKGRVIFSGLGTCCLSGGDVLACDFCDDFKCSVCDVAEINFGDMPERVNN